MLQTDADDWLVYEDRKVDYTSLKIDTLKLDNDSDPNEEEETNEDGEKVKRRTEGGPWSKLVASDSVEKPAEPEERTPGVHLNIYIYIIYTQFL